MQGRRLRGASISDCDLLALISGMALAFLLLFEVAETYNVQPLWRNLLLFSNKFSIKVRRVRLSKKHLERLKVRYQRLAQSSDHKKRIYPVLDFMRVTGLSLPKIRHWDKIGLLVPRFKIPAKGSQHGCYYSAREVVKAVMILEMLKRGLSLREIQTVEKNLQEQGLRLDESAKYLLTNGSTACYASSPTEVVDILKHEKQMLLILMFEPVQAFQKEWRLRMVG